MNTVATVLRINHRRAILIGRSAPRGMHITPFRLAFSHLSFSPPLLGSLIPTHPQPSCSFLCAFCIYHYRASQFGLQWFSSVCSPSLDHELCDARNQGVFWGGVLDYWKYIQYTFVEWESERFHWSGDLSLPWTPKIRLKSINKEMKVGHHTIHSRNSEDTNLTL